MLFHSKRGSIFAKHVVQAGLPDKNIFQNGKKKLYPSGFSGKRAAKMGKLYPIKARSDMDAIRAYHTMSANLASVEQLSLSLMSFVEETTGPDGGSAGISGFNLRELPVTAETNVDNNVHPPNEGFDPGCEQHRQQEVDNWQSKPEHYSDVGAFGMSYDDHGQGRGTSDFGSDIGGPDFGGAAGGSQLLHIGNPGAGAHRGPEGANDAGTGPFRFIMLANQGGGGDTNNNTRGQRGIRSGGDPDAGRSQAQLASFCPATPHGRRIFRERKKALQAERDRTLREEKMDEMLENAKPFKGPSFGQGLKKKSKPAFPSSAAAAVDSVEARGLSGSGRRRRRRTPSEGSGNSRAKQHMLPDDTHGWGHSAPPSAVQLEASVVGADTLDKLPVAVRRWEVGMSIPPEESVVIGKASSGGFSMSRAASNTITMGGGLLDGHMSPPGFTGGVSGGGAMVLAGGEPTTAVFGGDSMDVFFPVTESLDHHASGADQNSPANMDGKTFLTDALVGGSCGSETAGRERSNNSSLHQQQHENNHDRGGGVSPVESIGEVGAWEESDMGTDSVFKPIGSLQTADVRENVDRETKSRANNRSRRSEKSNGKGHQRRKTPLSSHRRKTPSYDQSRMLSRSPVTDSGVSPLSVSRRSGQPLQIAGATQEGRENGNEKQPKIMLRQPGKSIRGGPNIGETLSYRSVTIRVLQSQLSASTNKAHGSESKLLGGGGSSSTRGFTKAPEDRTTKHVQLLVRDDASVVEMVAFAMRSLNMPHGLKWSCQYLNREERRWIILLRNHTAGTLTSDKFHGLGPDGMHMRLVAPGYKGLKAALRAQQHQVEETRNRGQIKGILYGGKGLFRATDDVDDVSVSAPFGHSEEMRSMPSERAVLVEARQTAAARPSTTASVVSTVSNPGAGKLAHDIKSEENRIAREMERKKARDDAVALRKAASGKRFVMRQTPNQKKRPSPNRQDDRSSHARHQNGGGDRSADGGISDTGNKKTFDGWDQTPLFELEGWEREDGASPKFGRMKKTSPQRFITRHQRKVSMFDSPRDFDTMMEDYSSPERRERRDGGSGQEAAFESPDRDRTHAELSHYGTGGMSGREGGRHDVVGSGAYEEIGDAERQVARLPYLLASSHLLVDDEIDAGTSGAHTYRSSIASRKRRQQKNKAWKMASHIQLGPRGPRVDKMNMLAQKIIATFGKSRVLGGNQFRKARASEAVSQNISQRIAEVRRKGQQEGEEDMEKDEERVREDEAGGQELWESDDAGNAGSDFDSEDEGGGTFLTAAESSIVELPDIHTAPSVTFNMERLYATRARVPADVRVSDGRSRVLRPVSF